MGTLYDILKVKRDASVDEIKQAYDNATKQVTLDNAIPKSTRPNKRIAAAPTLKDLFIAYTTLSDKKTRNAYDQKLRMQEEEEHMQKDIEPLIMNKMQEKKELIERLDAHNVSQITSLHKIIFDEIRNEKKELAQRFDELANKPNSKFGQNMYDFMFMIIQDGMRNIQLAKKIEMHSLATSVEGGDVKELAKLLLKNTYTYSYLLTLQERAHNIALNKKVVFKDAPLGNYQGIIEILDQHLRNLSERNGIPNTQVMETVKAMTAAAKAVAERTQNMANNAPPVDDKASFKERATAARTGANQANNDSVDNALKPQIK